MVFIVNFYLTVLKLDIPYYITTVKIWSILIANVGVFGGDKVGHFDWNLLLKLTQDIPNNLNQNEEKEPISPGIRYIITKRDKVCKLCGSSKDLIIHHIIPNGSSDPDNLILLCRRCHYVVHLLLWISGKWKYPYRV